MDLRKGKIDLNLELSLEEVESIFRREKVEKSFRQIMTNSFYRGVEQGVLEQVKDYKYEKLDMSGFDEETLKDLNSFFSREYARMVLKGYFLNDVLKQVVLYDKNLEEQLVQTMDTKKAVEFLIEIHSKVLKHAIDVVSQIKIRNDTYNEINQIADLFIQYLQKETIIN